MTMPWCWLSIQNALVMHGDQDEKRAWRILRKNLHRFKEPARAYENILANIKGSK